MFACSCVHSRISAPSLPHRSRLTISLPRLSFFLSLPLVVVSTLTVISPDFTPVSLGPPTASPHAQLDRKARMQVGRCAPAAKPLFRIIACVSRVMARESGGIYVPYLTLFLFLIHIRNIHLVMQGAALGCASCISSLRPIPFYQFRDSNELN